MENWRQLQSSFKSAGAVVVPDSECPFKRNIVYAFEKLADDVFYFSRLNQITVPNYLSERG